MTIELPKAKKDQLREGNIVHVSRTTNDTCPIQTTEAYLKATGLKGEDYLISRLAKTKTGHNAIGRLPLSYSRISAIFHEFMDPVLEDSEYGISKYSLHSLRSGGATEAANNNVSDRKIRKHGRWRSNGSRDVYIKDDRRGRLEVTEKLGL